MGWGIPHTPLYIPDPRDPRDVAETALSHVVYGGLVWAGASAVAGVSAGPGHLGILYRAFLSPAHIGASYAGSSALADTMYAMSVYAEPFVAAARVVVPTLAVAALVVVESKVQSEYLLDIARDESQGGVSRVLDVNRTNVPIYYSSV